MLIWAGQPRNFNSGPNAPEFRARHGYRTSMMNGLLTTALVIDPLGKRMYLQTFNQPYIANVALRSDYLQ